MDPESVILRACGPRLFEPAHAARCGLLILCFLDRRSVHPADKEVVQLLSQFGWISRLTQ